MAYSKWIGAFLGFINSQSVLGALAGFAIGAVFDGFSKSKKEEPVQPDAAMHKQEGERNGFLFSLMVLAAHIIQADGKIMHSEMEFVRKFLRTNFGDEAEREGEAILLKLFGYRKQNGMIAWQQQIRDVCMEIATAMQEEHRIQLVAFLCQIAKADRRVDATEIQALKEIAISLQLQENIIFQMLSLGGQNIEDAYKVLGITPEASDDEVRKAYKKMALQHHPDRVASLGDDVKAAATKKFQEINEAKAKIFKERNMS